MKVIDEFYNQFQKGLSRLIVLLLIVIVGIFIYPLYDLNFGYLNRLEQRANILKTLSEISSSATGNNTAILYECDKLINELSTCNPDAQSAFKLYFEVSKNKPTHLENFLKTIAGGAIWIPLILLFISIGAFNFKPIKGKKGKTKFYNRIYCMTRGITSTQKLFIGLLILGCIIGYIIPLFNITSINYVLVPAFELLLFLIINKIYQSAKKENSDSQSSE